MLAIHKRFKIKILSETSSKRWVKAYIKDGTWRFVLRGEFSATQFPENMLNMHELLEFLSDKEFEIIPFVKNHNSMVL